MAKRYIQLPAKLTVDLRDPITEEAIPEKDIASGFPRSWAHMIRAVCTDPRLLEPNALDIFEVNEFRTLARAEPNSVHEVDSKVLDAVVPLLTKKSLVPSIFFSSGGVELVRCLVEAKTKDPRALKAVDEAQAAE